MLTQQAHLCVLKQRSTRTRASTLTDKEPAKRKFLIHLHKHLGLADAHVFKDICDLWLDELECDAHDGCKCPVHSGSEGPTFFSHIGFSCKNFSKLFSASRDGTRADLLDCLLQEGKGSSGSKFCGMFSFLARHPSLWVMWENVKELLEQQGGHIQHIETTLGKIGYVMAYRKLRSDAFGVPHARARVFGICLHVRLSGLRRQDAQKLAESVMDTATEHLSIACCKSTACSRLAIAAMGLAVCLALFQPDSSRQLQLNMICVDPTLVLYPCA